METITSSENETIKQICKLNSCKKTRLASKQMAIEGAKLLEEALKSRLKIFVCLVTLNSLQKYHKLISALPAITRLALIDEKLEGKLSTLKTPTGIYCICELPSTIPSKKQIVPGKHLALIGLQDPGNVGTIIRTAEAFGLNTVYTSSDCVDFFNPKVVKASMGSCFRQKLAIIADLQRFLLSCASCGLSTYAATLSKTSQPIFSISFAKSSIVFIGNEGGGLPREVLDQTKFHVKIPMMPEVDSLNASVAAALFIQRLMRSEFE